MNLQLHTLLVTMLAYVRFAGVFTRQKNRSFHFGTIVPVLIVIKERRSGVQDVEDIGY